jgi:pSer/pThr/pTyr-binding forkhead associated (FHA) protein
VEEPARPGKCRLICIAGVIKTKSFPLAAAKMTFGRNPASEVFLEDLSVSREHAMIKLAGDRLEVVDLGSRNGIEVNGRRVMTKMLNVGDKIKIGKNVFLIESTP